jgi:LysR family hydrogen peroxide-inducible transcriptional activator
MISLKQIHYALAVERTLHFKRAAQDCNISQSALSTALSELEKQLGFPVFERDNRKVLVTPLGKQVLDRVRSIALQMDDIQKLADVQGEPLSASLALGVIPTIGPYLLPRVLPAMQQRYPKLQLEIVEDETATLIDLLRRGALDAAVIALPYECHGLLTFSFWKEELYWVTHSNDPMAGRESVSAEDLQRVRLMLLKDGHCLTDHALKACKLEHLSSQAFSATSLTTLIQLVAAGMGSTLIPQIALEQLVKGKEKLSVVALSEPSRHRELVFAVRPNYPGLPDIEVLIELFNKMLDHNGENTVATSLIQKK